MAAAPVNKKSGKYPPCVNLHSTERSPAQPDKNPSIVSRRSPHSHPRFILRQKCKHAANQVFRIRFCARAAHLCISFFLIEKLIFRIVQIKKVAYNFESSIRAGYRAMRADFAFDLKRGAVSKNNQSSAYNEMANASARVCTLLACNNSGGQAAMRAEKPERYYGLPPPDGSVISAGNQR